jgi:hypothetical protein
MTRPQIPDTTQRYFLGLDLGKRVDRSALAILELQWEGAGFDYAWHVPIRNPIVRLIRADRFPLGLPYSQIPGILSSALHKLERMPVLPGNANKAYGKDLTVDSANAGSFLLEILQQQRLPATLVPVTITGGEREQQIHGGVWSVPRPILFSNLRILFEAGNLRIAQDLPGYRTLLEELLTAKASGPQREHDDVAIAVALAAWRAAREVPALRQPHPDRVIRSKGENLTCSS